MTVIEKMGACAKEASRTLAVAGSLKDKALYAIADALENNIDKIVKANEIDIKAGRENGLTESLIDRLYLDDKRIKGMADGVRKVAAMSDPIGKVIRGNKLPNGLKFTQVTVPLGVIGIIFEARPNVTADAAALCLKAGNTVILRGGKEAINSNTAVSDIMRSAIAQTGLPADCIQLIKDTTRASSTELMQLSEYLDVLIPRGGAGLIRAVVENSKVPVIETGVGNCHVYVDSEADLDMAAEIIFNAKTSRPSVCNAIETILVHKTVAETALPKIKEKLDTKNVEIRGCEITKAVLGDSVVTADETDYETEFGDYILACKVVDTIDDAIAHIAKYSSGHSDCIVTNDYNNANKFTSEVDSAAVYVNASTRFTDGGEFGFGAEIGISTQKLHARGPMGVNELTSSKFIVEGNGQVR
ncbi:MAG: glutamate-5-semialdehyde dehydrogenase [Ruminococcus sp.]|nr:glutamate-5-semialdehyde dehydrogenase [Ruminococcus sp.]